MAKIIIPAKVKLRESDHRYFHDDGREFSSVSRVIESYKVPFQRDLIASRSAEKRLKMQGEEVTPELLKSMKEVVLAEWTKKNRDAIDVGIRIHNAIDQFFRTAVVDPKNEDCRPMLLKLSAMLSTYDQKLSEQCLYHDVVEIAGTADKVCVRKGKYPVVDIFDFKTNLSKGIQYTNQYGQYLLEPLDHLEDCNFNTYSLQLSIYALLLQYLTNCKIGRLAILFINPLNPSEITTIPVPYMKEAAFIAIGEYEPQMKENVISNK